MGPEYEITIWGGPVLIRADIRRAGVHASCIDQTSGSQHKEVLNSANSQATSTCGKGDDSPIDQANFTVQPLESYMSHKRAQINPSDPPASHFQSDARLLLRSCSQLSASLASTWCSISGATRARFNLRTSTRRAARVPPYRDKWKQH